MKRVYKPKNCSKCNKLFNPNINNQKYCVDCKKIAQRERVDKYREKNKEKCRTSNKRWKEKNKEYCNIKSKLWNQFNKDKKKISDKKWVSENKEIVKLWKSKGYNKNKDKIYSRLKSLRKIKIPKGQICEECNINKALERHHEDYKKPLEVKFLCLECHNKKRRIYDNKKIEILLKRCQQLK